MLSLRISSVPPPIREIDSRIFSASSSEIVPVRTVMSSAPEDWTTAFG